MITHMEKYIMKLAAVYIAFALAFVSSSYSQNVREVKKTVDLSKDGSVFIDTYKGSITIETWDKPQVEVFARIEPDGWGRDAKESVANTEIKIDPSPGKVRIKSDYDRLNHHRSWFSGWFDDGNVTMPFVHYSISMPRTAHLSIKDYKSESRISDLQSSIHLETYKGSVAITGLDGSIDLETYKGDVTVDLVRLSEDSRFETYKGKIQIALASDAGFEIDTDLGRKVRFDSDFEAVYRSKRHSDNIEHGKVNGGGPMLRFSSEKGSIRLRSR
jgi:hypothetical protein